MTEMELRRKVINYLVQYVGCRKGSSGHKAILKKFNDSKLCSRYTMTVNDAWCATAVSAAFIAAGVAGKPGSGKLFECVDCSCNAMIQKAKNQGIWVEKDFYVPKIGDVVMYDWDDSGRGDCTGEADHVGIVTETGIRFHVIEGNKGNAVGYRSMSVNGRYIRGFIVPKYSRFATKAEPAKTESKKSVEEVAREVIDGKWGTGVDRKKRLTAAGYDYDTVQSKVNELLKSKKDVSTVAKEVLAGKWGNGAARKKRLTAAGYDYDAVQKKVNELAK